MRELVYLSDRKLAAFHPEPRRRPSLRAELGVPGVAKVGAELAAAPGDGPGLAEVLAHLSETPGKLRWYTEEDLRPGQWIQFEARLGMVVMDLPSAPPVVFFAELDADPGTRLILHGSPGHLLETAGIPTVRPLYNGSPAIAIRRLLATIADPGRDETAPIVVGGFHIRMLLHQLGQTLDPRAAATMSGYARVTVDAAEFGAVLASPLSVEYVSPR